MNQYKDKKVEEILEELKNVLDSITKQNKLDDKKLQEDSFKKIEDIKSILKSKQEKDVDTEKSQFPVKSTVQEISVVSTEIAKTKEEKLEEKEVSSEKQEKKEVTFAGQVFQEVTGSKEKILINTMFLFPSVLQDAKDLFFSNINSTLKRVSKKEIEVTEKVSIKYDSLTKDVFLRYSSIIERINQNNINLLILLVNEETFEVEDFIRKISSFVLLAKSIDIKGLKLKSTYLDLSIDLLLNVK